MIFIELLPYMGMVDILVMWPSPPEETVHMTEEGSI